MKRRIALGAALFIFLLISHKAFCMNEYKSDDEEAAAYNVTRSVKTVEGLNFRVEEDRPIVKVGGVYRPIDVDSYIALKYSILEKKMNEVYSNLQNKIDLIFSRLDSLTRKVEELSHKVEIISANQAISGNQTVAGNQTAVPR
jgi:hypothetical protein